VTIYRIWVLAAPRIILNRKIWIRPHRISWWIAPRPGYHESWRVVSGYRLKLLVMELEVHARVPPRVHRIRSISRRPSLYWHGRVPSKIRFHLARRRKDIPAIFAGMRVIQDFLLYYHFSRCNAVANHSRARDQASVEFFRIGGILST